MKKNKIPNEDIILANIIYANSNSPSEIKCPFCGSKNIKEDDVHFTSYKIGNNNINRKMYICQDCYSTFSVPVYDKTTGKITKGKDTLNISDDEYDPTKGAIPAEDFFTQLQKSLKSNNFKKFDNLSEFVRGLDALVCLIIFEDGTVHYVSQHTTLKNIRGKMLEGLQVDAVVKFTKKGIVYVTDLLNLKDVDNLKFSVLAKVIKDIILPNKGKGTDKKK